MMGSRGIVIIFHFIVRCESAGTMSHAMEMLLDNVNIRVNVDIVKTADAIADNAVVWVTVWLMFMCR